MNTFSTSTFAALFGDVGPGGETLPHIYGPMRLELLRRTTNLYSTQITSKNIDDHLSELHELEVIFSTWGMLPLSSAQLDRLPNLKAIFYAAGSVKCFAAPFLERDITVVSAWAANAVPVAELTLGQILMAGKGYFRNVREYQDYGDFSHAFRGAGNYGTTIAILGAGQVGRKLIELLHPFHMRVLVFDPFLSYKGADALGVEKVETLDEAFSRGDIVSNHLADVPDTEGLIGRASFCALRDNATFINTGRGRTVDHDALLQVFRVRADLTALLDVTHPEPLPASSPLRALPNVTISSHIAGSIGREVGRVADYILDEFESWQAGLPLRYAVTPLILESMA